MDGDGGVGPFGTDEALTQEEQTKKRASMAASLSFIESTILTAVGKVSVHSDPATK